MARTCPDTERPDVILQFDPVALEAVKDVAAAEQLGVLILVGFTAGAA